MASYLIFSTMEMIALIVLMLSVFRFQFKGYRTRIAFTSVILSFISYALRVEMDMGFIDAPMQIVILFFFIWLMFDLHAFYAAIMTSLGYTFYVLLQTILMYILTWFKVYSLLDVKEGTSHSTQILQTLTVLLALYVAWLIKRGNYGFNFVPGGNFGAISYRKGKALIVLIVLAFFSLGLSFYLMWTAQSMLYYLSALLLLFNFACMLYLQLDKKER